MYIWEYTKEAEPRFHKEFYKYSHYKNETAQAL